MKCSAVTLLEMVVNIDLPVYLAAFAHVGQILSVYDQTFAGWSFPPKTFVMRSQLLK